MKNHFIDMFKNIFWVFSGLAGPPLIYADTFQGLRTYSVLSAYQQVAIKAFLPVTLLEGQLI